MDLPGHRCIVACCTRLCSSSRTPREPGSMCTFHLRHQMLTVGRMATVAAMKLRCCHFGVELLKGECRISNTGKKDYADGLRTSSKKFGCLSSFR